MSDTRRKPEPRPVRNPFEPDSSWHKRLREWHERKNHDR